MSAVAVSEPGLPEGRKIDLSLQSSSIAAEASASLKQSSILGASSLMLSKASSFAITPRSGLQFNLKMGRTTNRKNRVLEVFPSDIFANGTLRKEFYLPLRIADTAREMLESRPPPYIKMINPLSVHALAERHSRVMALHPASSGDGNVSSLAGSFLDAGDRLLNILQVQQGVPILKYKLSLGLAMIDYVKEGCHSRDTSFFMLYMLSHESNSSSSPASVDDEDASKPKLDRPESSKSPESPSSSKEETKERWLSGTEVGKWFVFAIVDLVKMSPKKESNSDFEPQISVDTDNLERIATEYGRYLLKKEVPPRSDDDSVVRPRRGRKPKSMVVLGTKVGRSSRESESETESSLHDKGDEVSSEPSGGSLDHDVEKGKKGRKRGRQSMAGRDAKRSTGSNLSSQMGIPLDGSLASACNMLVSLNPSGAPTTSPQIPPFMQNSPQLFNLSHVNPAAPVLPQLFSMPHVSPPQGPSSFIEGANKSQGISFFHLTPSMFVPNDLPVANISPLIMAAATNGQSPSPPRTLFCLSPNVSPLLSATGQSLFRSPYYYSPPLMGSSLIPGGAINPNPAGVGSSLTLDTSIQQLSDNHTTQPAQQQQQQQTSVVPPSQFVS